MTESWRDVARALATRLNHATAPDHNPPLPDCPFCEDALAYARYMAKCASIGITVRDPFEGGVAVPLHEIRSTRARCEKCGHTTRGCICYLEVIDEVRRKKESSDLLLSPPRPEPETVAVWGVGNAVRHLNQPGFDELSWCGTRRQFRHRTIATVRANVTAEDLPEIQKWVDCPKCLRAIKRGMPYAWGR